MRFADRGNRIRTPAERGGVLRALCVPLLLAASGCGTSHDPPAVLSGRPLHLYDHLDHAAVSGAATLLAGASPGVERTLLAVDFEDGRLEPLAPFAGFGREVAGTAAFAGVVRGARGFAGGASAELRGDVPHGASLRTPPIPVEPGQLYRLRYRIAVEGLEAGRGDLFGGPSLLLYRVPPAESEEVAGILSQPGREKALRLRGSSDFRVTRQRGAASWRLEETVFTVPAAATHMVLSFDLSRSKDDRSAHEARGVARYDDIRLMARDDPLPLRHRELDDGAGPPHPLKLFVQLGHRARPYATEARYALAAPAPSALTFETEIPESGVLSVGYGLLPAAQLPGAPPVTFAVEVREAQGERRELFRDVLSSDASRWSDAEVDLAEFAGRRVQVALRTEGRPAPPNEAELLRRLPEAGAVWSYPILHSSSDRGRLLVLVGIDTLAAGRCSTYGYQRATTPALSRIAERGVLFRRALSPSPWTLPAFASMLTGLAPGRHLAGEGLRGERQGWRPLAAGFLTVVERLRRAGWETRAWINNPLMTHAFGLDQGFASYVDYATQGHDEAAEPGMSALLEYLARPRGHDRLLFVHLMDPHSPYRANDAFRQRFLDPDYSGRFVAPFDSRGFDAVIGEGGAKLPERDRRRVVEFYESAVAYSDWQLGRLFEALERASADAEVTLLVSSDHGEEFWEHGLTEHGHTLFDEVLHVPLVLWAPGRVGGPDVVEAPVSTQDVAATLLDAAGLEIPEELESRSLLDAPARHAEKSRLLVAENMLYGVQRMAVEQGGVKYVYNQQANGRPGPRAPRPAARHELYLLDADPGQTRNVFRREMQRALPLHEALARRFVASLGGAYVLRLDAGGDASGSSGALRWEAVLTLPPGAAWGPDVRDLVWPLADGSEAPLRVARRSKRKLELRVEARRALLAFTIHEGAGPVELTLSRDGRPLAPAQVGLGAATTRPGSLPARLDDAALRTEAQRLLDWRSDDPAALVARVPVLPELRRSAAQADVDAELREQLKALGYLSE